MIIEESVCFMSCEPFFLCAIILMWYIRNIFLLASDIFFINWTVRMSDNLPERVQILGHAHIICITVRENRIICCQIFCDLLLKSAFEQIFNVMQLILIKIKWKYLIQKFHDICLSYFFNVENKKSLNETKTTKRLKLDIKFYSDQYIDFKIKTTNNHAFHHMLNLRYLKLAFHNKDICLS
jgi:hypothetical protein